MSPVSTIFGQRLEFVSSTAPTLSGLEYTSIETKPGKPPVCPP